VPTRCQDLTTSDPPDLTYPALHINRLAVGGAVRYRYTAPVTANLPSWHNAQRRHVGEEHSASTWCEDYVVCCKISAKLCHSLHGVRVDTLETEAYHSLCVCIPKRHLWPDRSTLEYEDQKKHVSFIRIPGAIKKVKSRLAACRLIHSLRVESFYSELATRGQKCAMTFDRSTYSTRDQ
jgi:hypothetical protein